MELHFVTAADGTPLTKQFTRTDAGYEKQSYPNITLVNSTKVETDGSPEQFCFALQSAAELSACLITGRIDRELKNESRAGHKLENQLSEYVVFDIDDMTGIDSIEQFIHEYLPKPFQDVSYIAQHSASSGIVGTGVRAHVFFMLDEPVDPSQIKLWTTETNVDTPSLRSQLTLNAGGGSLRYPLDRVANDHARIVFIAPPICTNFKDPLADERIVLITKSQSHVVFPFHSSSAEVIRRKEREVIKSLRDTAGLPAKTMKVSSIGGFDVLVNADEVEVTEWWEGNGFVHLNLDGGDSGAYWINPKRPKYIQNFKGEPALILKKVAPKFWEEIKELCVAEEMLLFRDINTDKYYCGEYEPIEDKILWMSPIAKSNIKNWVNDLYDRDIDTNDIDNLFMEFNPHNKKTVDKPNRFVNMFDPTDYMRLPLDEGVEYEIPPTIGKLLHHLCGNDDEVFEWVLNREAVIFQHRVKTGTALVIQGVPGTGKGFYNEKVIQELYGQYAQTLQMDKQDGDIFNSFLKDCLVLYVEESKASTRMRDRLFHWIADKNISVRAMHQEAKQYKTYCNFTFTSNHHDAVQIEEMDRRYTVTPYQENRLLDVMTDEELDVDVPRELSQYARYLLTREADIAKARIPLENEAKEQMRLDNMTSADMFVDAIKQGNLDWLVARFVEGGGTQGMHSMGAKRALQRWAPGANQGPTPAFKSDLMHFYVFVTGRDDTNEVEFGNMLRNRGFSIKASDRVMIDGERKSGRQIDWHASEDTLRQLEKLLGESSPALDALKKETVAKL